ncbi:unnamed protein product [Lota lota]
MSRSCCKAIYFNVVAFGVVLTTLSLYVYYGSTVASCKTTISDVEKPVMEKPIVEKPIVLVWFTPFGITFDFNDCGKYFNITSCTLTYDKSLYNQSSAVIIFHKDIHGNLMNLPKEPRPPFQKWIWYHVESPTNTGKVPGLENLFNLTLNYRRDADITVRTELMTKNYISREDFVLPPKTKLLCWIVSNTVQATGTAIRERYYHELSQHIKVDIFGSGFTANRLPYEAYFSSIASCKFYLSFENSIHRDYITEKVNGPLKLNGPLAVGTVPVVLGPPRKNYEDFVPGDSLVHVNDFPDAKSLAEFLKRLDADDNAYRRYFQWREHFSAHRHPVTDNHKYLKAICTACDYSGRNRDYRVIPNLHKWYFG